MICPLCSKLRPISSVCYAAIRVFGERAAMHLTNATSRFLFSVFKYNSNTFARTLHCTLGHSFSLRHLFPICAKLRAWGWNRKSAAADRSSRVSRGSSRWPPAQPLLARAAPLSTSGPVIHCCITASMLWLDKSIPPWRSAHCSPAAAELPAARKPASLDGAETKMTARKHRYELRRHWINTRIIFVSSSRTTVHREEIFIYLFFVLCCLWLRKHSSWLRGETSLS